MGAQRYHTCANPEEYKGKPEGGVPLEPLALPVRFHNAVADAENSWGTCGYG